MTDIRDLTTLFSVILRRASSEWLESSMESDFGQVMGSCFGMRFAARSFDLAFELRTGL